MKVIQLTQNEIDQIRINAHKASWNGRSCVRTRGERLPNLVNDQYTGQAGEAALSKLLTGSIQQYLETRELRNQDPYAGDGGTDLVGLQVDIKTSRMRRGPDFNYHLWIRENEYHADTRYYLGLMPMDRDDVVVIAGWVDGRDVPAPVEGNRREMIMSDLRTV